MFSIKRVLNKAPSMSRMWAIRNFSSEVSLFRPIATAVDIPAREIMHNLHETHAMTAAAEAKFEEYNQGAIEEYDQMIQNRIDSIVARNGISEWELAEDNGFLRKTFTFGSPENAHFFMNEVSKVCSKTDHHPEWKLINEKSIEVYLTSHFAGNKVSINDYELAESMNKIEGTAQSHNYYSNFSKGKAIEYIIGFMLVGFLARGIRPTYEEVDVIDGTPKVHDYNGVNPTLKVDNQLDDYSLQSIKDEMKH